jgi:hypothetical protein
MSHGTVTSRRAARGRSVVTVTAPVIFLIAATILARAVLDSPGTPCPAPPSPLGVDIEVLAADALPERIPDRVPGFALVAEGPVDVATVVNRNAKAAFVKAGLLSGFTREFRNETTTATYSVLQFPTADAAVRYEGERIASLCRSRHAALAVPSGTGASAMVIKGAGAESHRFVVVRGSREYVMAVVAHQVSGDTELFSRFVGDTW